MKSVLQCRMHVMVHIDKTEHVHLVTFYVLISICPWYIRPVNIPKLCNEDINFINESSETCTKDREYPPHLYNPIHFQDENENIIYEQMAWLPLQCTCDFTVSKVDFAGFCQGE